MSRAEAQCVSVPTTYTQACTEVQGYLSNFNATLSQWDGTRGPVTFASELLTANCNRALVLLQPSTMTEVENELNALARTGVKAVTVCLNFPILYQPFYTYNNDPQDYAAMVTFYQNVAAAVRNHGMKLIVETLVLFPDIAKSLPLTAYYGTLSADQLNAGRAQNAVNIAQQIQPDWLNLGSEPDTECALLGLPAEYTAQEFATQISTMVSQLRTAGISGKPLLGAGVGTWQQNGSDYIQALLGTGVDYLDLHIYSVNLNYMNNAVTYLDMAHAAGKGAAISEVWLYKMTDADLEGQNEYGIIKVISDDSASAVFSFWEPLDFEFLGQMIDLAYWKNLYYLSPFTSNLFFAYVDYNSQTSTYTAAQLNAAANQLAAAAMQSASFSHTGLAFSIDLTGTGGATTVSAADYKSLVAPASIVSIYGGNLASSTAVAKSVPLPTSLGGSSATITDSNGASAALPLFFASPGQINAEIPAQASTGPATITLTTPSGTVTSFVTLASVAPSLFSANASGKGVAAAQVVTNHANGSQTTVDVFQCAGGAGSCMPAPIDLGSAGDSSALVLYGTGIRNRAALSDVTVTIGSYSHEPFFADAAPVFVGLDQVNVLLPHTLAGSGTVNVTVSVAGTVSNVAQINFK